MREKTELMKYMGSMQQAAYVRPLTFAEGRSTGLKAWEVKNGQLSYKVLADKCLDVGELSYRGVNFSFLSKPGLQGRNHYDTAGDEAIRSIMGGMFFTAGLESICAPCTIDGVDYPMHGRIRTTPAEHLSGDAFWKDGEYHLAVSGEIREAALFGENLVLRRSIETVYGQKTVTVTDRFENERLEFFRRVRKAYLDAARDDSSIEVIDASRTESEVTADIRQRLEVFLCSRG